MGRPIIFKCPQTGVNVQHWLTDEPDPAALGRYEPVVCQACTKMHFVHSRSGKLLGSADRASALK